VQLPDGTAVLVRPIRSTDKRLLSDGLARLSAETVYRRFLTSKPRFTSGELRYLTEVDGYDHVAYVAVLATDPDELVGVGRWIRRPGDPDAAEVAVVVGDCWQGQGLGRRLGMALADAARTRNVERFTATMAADNVPAHRLFAAISDRLRTEHHGGIDELVADLAA